MQITVVNYSVYMKSRAQPVTSKINAMLMNLYVFILFQMRCRQSVKRKQEIRYE